MLSDYDKRLLNEVEKIRDNLLANELEFFSVCKKKELLTVHETRQLSVFLDSRSDRAIAFSECE